MDAGWISYGLTNGHEHFGVVWDVVTDSRIVELVADLLGETVIVRHSHLFAIVPGASKRVNCHQDVSYWPPTSSRFVLAWLAIDMN